MEFTLRDIVYIGIYIATVAGLYVRFQDRVRVLSKVIFLERGGLNVVTKEECEKHQASLRQHSQDAVDQISILHENITIIMLDRGLKPVPLRPKTITKN